MFSRWLLTLACACLGLANAGSSRAGFLSFQIEGQQGDYTLHVNGEAAVVEHPRGDPVHFSLPASARVSSFAALQSGWIAAVSHTVEGQRRLLLFTQTVGAPDAVQKLAPPPGPIEGARDEPVLFVDGGRLVGLAWLEGRDRRSLGVRAAAWSGVGWDPTQSVALPAAGSQLALTGAVLGDGSWLLAWSAFDGEDDEVLWSQRQQAYWSTPRGVARNNRVPDITPALVAVGDGALLAWSRYDGSDYRIVLSRLGSDGWGPVLVLGEPGSLQPTFQLDDGRCQLLYQTVRPAGWGVLELEASGRVRRRAFVSPSRAVERIERPLLGESTPRSLILRWPSTGRQISVPWVAQP